MSKHYCNECSVIRHAHGKCKYYTALYLQQNATGPLKQTQLPDSSQSSDSDWDDEHQRPREFVTSSLSSKASSSTVSPGKRPESQTIAMPRAKVRPKLLPARKPVVLRGRAASEAVRNSPWQPPEAQQLLSTPPWHARKASKSIPEEAL